MIKSDEMEWDCTVLYYSNTIKDGGKLGILLPSLLLLHHFLVGRESDVEESCEDRGDI